MELTVPSVSICTLTELTELQWSFLVPAGNPLELPQGPHFGNTVIENGSLVTLKFDHLLFCTGIQVVPRLLTLGTQAAPLMVSVETQTDISSFVYSPMQSQTSQCTFSQSSEQSGRGPSNNYNLEIF